MDQAVDAILNRKSETGAFTARTGGQVRTDSTAWAVLALAVAGESTQFLKGGREYLTERQLVDGRVPVLQDHPRAYWPTSLAILAWKGDQGFKAPMEKAIRFLLEHTGLHWPRTPDQPLAHDTSIPGWPWIDQTHSWVEPTSLALLSLRSTGFGDHPRVRQGLSMIMDRQLPTGGWNYGNNMVFGQELNPMPEATGMALCVLEEAVPRKLVDKSLDYLEGSLEKNCTPEALCWSLLALSAWRGSPSAATPMLERLWERQQTLGPFDTMNISLMLIAALAPNGVLKKLAEAAS